jgi:hypothetical protein
MSMREAAKVGRDESVRVSDGVAAKGRRGRRKGGRGWDLNHRDAEGTEEGGGMEAWGRGAAEQRAEVRKGGVNHGVAEGAD